MVCSVNSDSQPVHSVPVFTVWQAGLFPVRGLGVQYAVCKAGSGETKDNRAFDVLMIQQPNVLRRSSITIGLHSMPILEPFSPKYWSCQVTMVDIHQHVG
jgi:hypothetical protein